jgi:hypothetical protein
VPQFDTGEPPVRTSDFDALVGAITRGYLPADRLPAVSFLKAPGYQDGHPGYSDPIDEQQFIANEINALEHTPDWASTAVVIVYDDSDGWYDHAYSGVRNPSNTARVANPPGPQDFLSGTGLCGPASATPLAGQAGRCGYGPRMPLLVISPWARRRVRRPHPDRPELDPPVRRGQLAPAADQRLVRRPRRPAELDVQLRRRARREPAALPRSGDRPAGWEPGRAVGPNSPFAGPPRQRPPAVAGAARGGH